MLSNDFALKKMARELGQHDPNAKLWEPAANENAPVRPNWRGDLFLAVLAFVLIGAALLAFFG
jgi:hypothetical protein